PAAPEVAHYRDCPGAGPALRAPAHEGCPYGWPGTHLQVGGGYAEFERGIAAALSSDTSERRRQRSDAMRAETWERKVAQVSAHVMRVKAQKQGSGVRGRGTGPAESKTAFDVDLAALTPDPRPLTPGEQ